MSIENVQQENRDSQERFKIREAIQLELINRYYGFEVSDNEHIVEWLKEYAGDYAKAFKEIATEDFFELYKINPEDALLKIEEELSRIHSHI